PLLFASLSRARIPFARTAQLTEVRGRAFANVPEKMVPNRKAEFPGCAVPFGYALPFDARHIGQPVEIGAFSNWNIKGHAGRVRAIRPLGARETPAVKLRM